MLRVCLTGWAVFIVVLVLMANNAAHATPTAAAPSGHPEGDCAWTQNGDQEIVDGFVYQCMCELVHQAGEYWCHWQLVSAPARVQRKAKRPKRSATHGIGTAVMYIRAPVAVKR